MDRAWPSLEELLHLTLLVGRNLLQSNQETDLVHEAIARTAEAYGASAHTVVTYESLIITLSRGDQFRTKAGKHIQVLNVNMETIAASETILLEIESGLLDCQTATVRFEAVDAKPPTTNRWMVVGGLALTCAALSRLFGGDWATFGIAGAAGFVCMWVRTEFARRKGNGFLGVFAAAFAGGCVAGIAVRLGLSTMPAICFLAPGMILVPGVPLVNGVQDIVKNHMVLGVSRLVFSVGIVISIALGLILATALTGVDVPVAESSPLLPVWEDAIFAGLAALGYGLLFNVPWRLAWVGVICGMASHSLRIGCMELGFNIILGSLFGALTAGLIAHVISRRFQVPFAAFVFPGVVAMIPGSLAFRAMIGLLEMIRLGQNAPLPLVAETLTLLATALLMVVAIGVGVAAPSVSSRRKSPH